MTTPTKPFQYLAAVWAVAACLVCCRAPAAPEQLVPNEYEAEAIAKGEKLGIGSAALEGPEKAEVLSYQTWTFVYTAGKAGIKPGGGIRIGMRHLPQWSEPQTTDPEKPGFLSVKTPRGVPAKVETDFRGQLFRQYFAWHNIVEVTLPEQGLRPGETIRVTFGDTSGGSPGIRVQPFDEPRFTFRTYVDALGKGEYLPLAESPAVAIVAAEPARLAVVMPSDAVAGEPTWCLVRAEDRYGNPAPRYRGTVRWRSSDPNAKLPEPFTFTEAEEGVIRLADIVFTTPGIHTISVADGIFTARGNPVRVTDKRAERLLLWGDLHGHTLQSDGRGTVAQYYEFAQRVAGLDFCAVTDHAFETTDAMWAHSKAVTNRFNEPGRFVTFNGYEWSGNTNVGGDHNVYFLDDDPPIYRSDNYYDPRNLQMYHGTDPKLPHVTALFAALQTHLASKDVLCIPHFGGRRGNPQWHNPDVQRLIEIFSEHRRSEDWAGTFLAAGHRVGIIASTDDHYGNPGYGYLRPTGDWKTQEIGMAAVAVHAPEHTREAVFRALYDRHTYATSGDRIILDVRADGNVMGSEYRTKAAPTIAVEAVGTAPIARIEINKNGKVVHAVEPKQTAVRFQWKDPQFDAEQGCFYYVRVVQENNEEAICSPIWVN